MNYRLATQLAVAMALTSGCADELVVSDGDQTTGETAGNTGGGAGATGAGEDGPTNASGGREDGGAGGGRGRGGAGGTRTTGVGGGIAMACVQCSTDNCSTQINACVSEPACVDGIQCVLAQCVSDGMVDAGCLTACYVDAQTLQLALAAVMCINSNCGAECLDALTGSAQ